MKLTKKQRDIIHGKLCPYCGAKTKKVSMNVIYGKKFGAGNDVICCQNYPKCNSYVGTHDDGTSLGRLANYELRIAKKKAHASFDKLWKEGILKRNKAYKLLSEYLNIPGKYTHIGMFQISTCYHVEKWADEQYRILKSNISHLRQYHVEKLE